jgi:O-acetylserine/cysteine efflux transporter
MSVGIGGGMRGWHILAAVGVAALWGTSFVVVRIGLNHFPPLLMAAIRFVISAAAVVFLPRPKVAAWLMVAIGMTLFVGEFGLLFTGMAQGVPAGLASVAIQGQAFFTLIIVAIVTRGLPSTRHSIGAALGLIGLAVVASTLGGDVTTIGMFFTILAGLSWAIGNVLMKRVGQVNMLAMVAWLSLIPPLPLLLLSLATEGPARISAALSEIDLVAFAAIFYLAVPATLVAFAIWGKLLAHYPAQVVAPFSLLVPLFGLGAASLVFGESISGGRLVGIAFVVSGLFVVTVPVNARALFRLIN